MGAYLALDVPEDPGQGVRVGLLDAVEDVLEPDAHVLVELAQVAPVAALGQLEAVVVVSATVSGPPSLSVDCERTTTAVRERHLPGRDAKLDTARGLPRDRHT